MGLFSPKKKSRSTSRKRSRKLLQRLTRLEANAVTPEELKNVSRWLASPGR